MFMPSGTPGLYAVELDKCYFVHVQGLEWTLAELTAAEILSQPLIENTCRDDEQRLWTMLYCSSVTEDQPASFSPFRRGIHGS